MILCEDSDTDVEICSPLEPSKWNKHPAGVHWIIYSEHIQSTLRQVAWNWKLISWWRWRKRVEIRKTNTLWPGESVSFQREIEASICSAEKYFPCYGLTPLKCKRIQDDLGFRFYAMDSGSQALNSSLWWWSLDSGLQSLVRFQIPKPMILNSTGKISPDSGFHEKNYSDSGIRVPLHWAICTWVYTKGLGTAESVEPADVTQQGYSSSPQMTAHIDLQHFTSNDVHTHDIRPGVRCRLRNGVIGSRVESSKEKVDLRLPLCFQRQCTPVTASSQTSSFLEPRIFKSQKSHKPVCKTYRLESSVFFSI